MRTVVTMIAVCMLLLGVSSVNAEEPAILAEMGLGDMAVVSDAEGLDVRGKGGGGVSDLWPFILEREQIVQASFATASTSTVSTARGQSQNFDLALMVSRSSASFATFDASQASATQASFAAASKLVFVGPKLPHSLPK